MSHGPIFLWQLIYQAKTEPVNLGAPETVTESRWHQPWSEPSVKTKAGLAPANQQFLAFQNPTPLQSFVSQLAWRVPFAEPVRIKPGLAAAAQAYLFFNPQPLVSFSYFENLSEPVRVKPGLAAQQQQFLAYTAFTPTTTVPTVDGWGTQLSTPQRQLLGLTAAEQQFFTADPSVIPTSNLPTWFYPWSDPVRAKLGLAANLQDPYADFPFVDTVVESRWHQPWSEPPKPKASLAAAAQQFLATSLFFTAATPPVDSWGAQLSIPQRRLLGLPATQQQFLAYAEAAPFPETVSEDRWHEPWAEPVRTKPALPAGEQQAVAFVPVVTTQVFEDSWHRPWTDPIQLNAAWKTADNTVGFIAGQSPTPAIDGWGSPWSEPPRPKPGTTAAVQQFLAFAPFVTTTVPSIDGWAQPWSDPPKPKVSINVAAQQALAWDPNTIFGESVLVSEWFRNLDPPPPPRPGLSAAQQQALGWNANVIFAENIFMSAWFAEYSNPVRTLTGHSIPSGFDTGSIPPFPIPNPPQTQAKFTVSGPSVSDLFPVSGVVYPYAPETRKTVP